MNERRIFSSTALPYAAVGSGKLTIERSPTDLTITIPPDTFRAELKSGIIPLGIMTLLTVAFPTALVVTKDARDWRFALCLVTFQLLALSVVYLSTLLVIAFWNRDRRIRIEVTPAHVRLIVEHRRRTIAREWDRATITSVRHVRYLGVQLRQSPKGCKWICYGTQSEQRHIAMMLRDALGVGA